MSDARRKPLIASKNPVYFLHIPKTAGSSIHKFLATLFPPDAICPAKRWTEIGPAHRNHFGAYRVFSGHFLDCLDPYLGVSATTMTVLRDPVERTISHYAHIRRDLGHPYHDLVSALSLREFCMHPETRFLAANLQTAYLATRAANPIEAEIDREARGPRADPLTARPALEIAQDSDLVARARARLQSCIAVGTTERLAETLELFAARLGKDWHRAAPRENASYNRPKAIDQDTLALIASMNQMDATLYREAQTLLDTALSRQQDANAAPNGAVQARPAFGVRPQRGPASLADPETQSRVKRNLAGAIARLPSPVRRLSSAAYVGYRCLVDRRTRLVFSLPWLLALAYVFGPIDLVQASNFVLGHVDEGTALVVGSLISRACIDKRLLAEFRFAARARFEPT